MARSAVQDVYEKFRFRVTFFDSNPTLGSILSDEQTISSGFSEVTLPKMNITERTYRENIDGPRYIKAAGLATYEPISLKRGKIGKNRELYKWLKLVNDDITSLSKLNELLAASNLVPVLSTEYRKDLIIQLLDREGVTKRAWFVFNAFPSGYKGGDDLLANDDTKLVEELTLSYEGFVELETEDIDAATAESQQAALNALAAGAIAFLTG